MMKSYYSGETKVKFIRIVNMIIKYKLVRQEESNAKDARKYI